MAGDFVLTPDQVDQLRKFAPDHLKVVRQMQRQARRAKSDAAKAAPGMTATQPELVIDLSNLMDRLTVGDMEDIERAAGVPAFAMSFFGGPIASVAGLAALIWILRRKDEPKYTYVEARAIPARVLMDLLAAFNAATPPPEEVEDDAAPLEPIALPSA